MDGFRAPVGDLPPEVYWRRRAVLALGLIVLGVVAYFLISSPGGGATTPGTSVSPEATVSPDSSATVSPGTVVSRACTSDDVAITVTANPHDFGEGALPVFDVTISMNGLTPCTLSTAGDDSELLITSGSDRIFSSADCPADATINARDFILQPDAPDETFQVTWSRQRSVPECTAVSAVPKPGTYHAQLTLQGIAAGDATFTLS